MPTKREVLNTYVLPAFITLLGAALTTFVSWIVDLFRSRRENRIQQVEKATEVCDKIIASLDTLHALMKNEAWYIAWRKKVNNYPIDDMIESDKARWEKYQEALFDWSSHEIEYETELRGYFGENGYEAYLMAEIVEKIDYASTMLWKIYYQSDDGANAKDEDLLMWKKGQPTTVYSARGKRRGESMRDYFLVVDRLRECIASLSATMIHCLQCQNVGNLKKKQVPIPKFEKDKEVQPLMKKDESLSNV
mmetsp:Transcript_10522/g.15650  ORF Transcript_10522/g.15650 Transcript_10522/m.15650 type:complete len:249 (-) Transcript_10522:1120-1866(-)